MPLFDPEKMVRLASEMRKSLARLTALGKMDVSDFVADPDRIGSAKYHFIVAIEICIDMCNHVISRNGYRVPEDYADTFEVMSEAGAIEESFAEELKNMARFRNRLVHLYWEVDDRQVHHFLQTRLADFKCFLDALAVFLNWSDEPT